MNPPDATENSDPGSVAGRIAWHIAQEHYGTGPHAELRRMSPAQASSVPALQRLLVEHVRDDALSADAFRRWALIVHCLALAPSRAGGPRLGTGLFDAGMKDGRFVNVLDADLAELMVRLPRAMRFLAAKSVPLEARGLAWLVMTADRDSGEECRRRIAADYYAAEYKSSKAA